MIALEVSIWDKYDALSGVTTSHVNLQGLLTSYTASDLPLRRPYLLCTLHLPVARYRREIGHAVARVRMLAYLSVLAFSETSALFPAVLTLWPSCLVNFAETRRKCTSRSSHLNCRLPISEPSLAVDFTLTNRFYSYKSTAMNREERRRPLHESFFTTFPACAKLPSWRVPQHCSEIFAVRALEWRKAD